MKGKFLRPGSPEAQKAGCICAVYDNYHGKGFMMDGKQCYWMTQTCKLHGIKETQTKLKGAK